jgi:OOP family OmpA-OmpF porin
MKKILVGTILSIAIATPAFADNGSGIYAALDYQNVSFGGLNDGGSTNFPSPGAFRLAGGYHFSQNFGVEAGYSMIGDSTIQYTGASAKIAATSLQLAAVGTFPISNSFDLFGKLGLVSNSLKLSGTGAYSALSTDNTSSNVLLGIGAQYNISKQVGIRVEYEDLGKTDVKSNLNSAYASSAKMTAFSVGVVYNF